MAKPAQITEIDEARRVIGMIESVSNPKEYQELFGISNGDIEYYRELLNRREIMRPKFIDSL